MNGSSIVPDENVDIILHVKNVEPVESPVSYRAWCVDEAGETVIVTVFEDNQPETRLEKGVGTISRM